MKFSVYHLYLLHHKKGCFICCCPCCSACKISADYDLPASTGCTMFSVLPTVLMMHSRVLMDGYDIWKNSFYNLFPLCWVLNLAMVDRIHKRDIGKLPQKDLRAKKSNSNN